MMTDGVFVLSVLLAGVIGLVAGYGAGYIIGHMRGYSCKVGDVSMREKPRITAQDIINRKNHS